jgi:hypothetical protein
MTDRAALIIGLLIIGVLLADHFVLHFGIALFLGRKLVQFIEYLQFWN